MDGFDQAARDVSGRFQPGQSGNPKGKRPGTRNRATLMAEALAEGEAEALLRIVVEKALAGDGVAARFLLGRIYAKPRGRSIRLALPKGARPGDVVAAFNATLAAMAAGEITPDEALIITRVLEGRARTLQAFALEKKLTRYGERIPADEIGAGEGACNSAAEPVAPLALSNALAEVPGFRENGRGSDAGIGGRGSDDGASVGVRHGVSVAALLPPNLQFACNEAALAALERQQTRRTLARMGLLPQARAGAEAAAP